VVSDTKDGSSRSLIFYPLFFLLLVFGAILRLSNFDFFFTDFFGHYNFFDPDSYYQLRRLAFFLQNFPESLRFDPLLAWPAGDVAHWPKLSLWLYGFPLWLFGANSYQALEIGASYLSILFGLMWSVLIYFVARQILDRSFSLLILFLSLINPFLIRYSCLGQVDHHIFELLLVPIAMILGLKSFSSARSAFFLGGIFALSFGISSSVLFVIGALIISFALVDIRRDKRREFLSLLLGFTLLFPFMMLWHQDIWRQNFDLHMPSFFQGVSVLGLFLVVWPLIFLKRLSHIFCAYLIILLVASVFFLFTPMQTLLHTAIHYVFGRTGIISHVIEARPLFYGLSHFQFYFVLHSLGYFFPVLLGFFLIPLFWKKLSRVERFYFSMGFFLLIPALAQSRFVLYFLAFYFIFLVWSFRALLHFLKERQIRVRLPAILGFVLIPIFPGLETGFAPDLDPRTRVDFSILHLAEEKNIFDRTAAWERLGEKNPKVGGIWANPNMGHLLTYISGMGSLVDPFYIGSSLRKDFEGRRIEEQTKFFEFLDANRIDLIFLLNDYVYFQMLHETFREPMRGFARRGANRAYYFDLQELESYFWIRSILKPDTDWPGFEEILQIQVVENHLYNFARIMQRKKIKDAEKTKKPNTRS